MRAEDMRTPLGVQSMPPPKPYQIPIRFYSPIRNPIEKNSALAPHKSVTPICT